jgi:hypothetical protein
MADKIWELHDPRDHPSSAKTSRQGEWTATQPPKNPAVAASLSILLWGGGQIYNRQLKLGLIFSLCMMIFYLGLGCILTYLHPAIFNLKPLHITSTQTLGLILFLYMLSQVFWIFNIFHAYFNAAAGQARTFQGVDHAVLPLFSSLFVPRWGQILYGKPKKGLFFWSLPLQASLPSPPRCTLTGFGQRWKTPPIGSFWNKYCLSP